MNNVFAIAGVVVRELIRRKDFYVLFILTALITLVMGSVHFFNDDKIVRYLKEICLLLIWICSLVIAITMTARQIPMERENRTIFPLLAKPVTRGQLLLGKFAGCWFAGGLSLLVFDTFGGIICAAREHELLFVNYLQALWLHWMLVGLVVALTLMGSILLTPTANIVICFMVSTGILLVGRHLHKVATQLEEPSGTILSVIYYAIPHLEFFDVRDLVIHNWENIPWFVIGLASLYAAAYAALFLSSAWLLFRHRALN